MKRLLLTDWATLIYAVFTSIVVLMWWPRMETPWALLSLRIIVVAAIFALLYIYKVWPNRLTMLARLVFPLLMLGVWYPDTFEFSRHLPNLDHLFAQADHTLFGCQPAYEMSLLLTGKVWSELFNAGYFSYFLMIALGALIPLCCKREEMGRTVFVVTAGFFAYYVIYLFLPVTGPQFYFTVIDPTLIPHGPYPSLEDYFNLHPDTPITGNEVPGFFQSLVEMAHNGGERPVAAFPSSHVGMSTVLMILFWQLKRGAFFAMLPLYVLLCASTVYIGAHYLVDVFGGWATALLFYALFNAFYRKYAPDDETYPL